MKAVVFHGEGDIRIDDVPEPQLQAPTDAIVRLTASAICGTDLHFIRGSFPDMQPGTILGHEGVGVVEQLGPDVRNLKVGDRVVIPSTIACGNCSYCRAGYFAQCDVANPNGKSAGTSFFGGPKATGLAAPYRWHRRGLRHRCGGHRRQPFTRWPSSRPRAMAARRRPSASPAVGYRRPGQGRYAVDHRGLPTRL